MGAAATRGRMIALLAPRSGIGPAQLAVTDVRGSVGPLRSPRSPPG